MQGRSRISPTTGVHPARQGTIHPRQQTRPAHCAQLESTLWLARPCAACVRVVATLIQTGRQRVPRALQASTQMRLAQIHLSLAWIVHTENMLKKAGQNAKHVQLIELFS